MACAELWKLVFVAVFVGLASHGVQAADFFVATSGNDSASGSSAMPWRTLQHAANSVGPGDRVTVHPGEYTNFRLLTSGTAGSPIEFFAEPGVLINTMQPSRPDGINLELASHVVIDGFSVTGMSRAGIRSVGLDSAFAEDVTIRNVNSYDNVV